jgi:hypothetical protein
MSSAANFKMRHYRHAVYLDGSFLRVLKSREPGECCSRVPHGEVFNPPVEKSSIGLSPWKRALIRCALPIAVQRSGAPGLAVLVAFAKSALALVEYRLADRASDRMWGSCEHGDRGCGNEFAHQMSPFSAVKVLGRFS